MSLFSKNKYEEKRLKKNAKAEEKELNYQRKTIAKEQSFQEEVVKINVKLQMLEEKFANIVDVERKRINYYSKNDPDYDLTAAQTRLKNAFYSYKLVKRQQIRMQEVQGNRDLRVALNDMSRTMGFINRINDPSGPIKDMIFKLRLKVNDSAITKMGNPSDGVANAIEESITKHPAEYLVSDSVVDDILKGREIESIKDGYTRVKDSMDVNRQYDQEHGISDLIDAGVDDDMRSAEIDKVDAFLNNFDADEWFNE